MATTKTTTPEPPTEPTAEAPPEATPEPTAKKPLFIGLCDKCGDTIRTNLVGEPFCPIAAPDCPRGL